VVYSTCRVDLSRYPGPDRYTKAPPQAPPREEGGRANGHRVDLQYQGADGRNSSLHHTLVKGESKNLVLHTNGMDDPESSDRKHQFINFNYRDYKLPKLDFSHI